MYLHRTSVFMYLLHKLELLTIDQLIPFLLISHAYSPCALCIPGNTLLLRFLYQCSRPGMTNTICTTIRQIPIFLFVILKRGTLIFRPPPPKPSPLTFFSICRWIWKVKGKKYVRVAFNQKSGLKCCCKPVCQVSPVGRPEKEDFAVRDCKLHIFSSLSCVVSLQKVHAKNLRSVVKWMIKKFRPFLQHGWFCALVSRPSKARKGRISKRLFRLLKTTNSP